MPWSAPKAPSASRWNGGEAQRRDADARLFPRRGRGGPAVLALSRRPLRPRDRAARRASPCSRTGSCTDCSHDASCGMTRLLCRDRHHHQFLVSARRLASAGIRASGERTAACRDRHRRPQHAGRRGAGLQANSTIPNCRIKPKLLIGARLVFIDGTPDILAYPRDRAAYGRLCRLLTRGKLGDGPRRANAISSSTISWNFAEGQLLVLTLPHRFEAAEALKVLDRVAATAAPTASGSPPACSIAATTGAGWRGCIDRRDRRRAAARDQRGAVPPSARAGRCRTS